MKKFTAVLLAVVLDACVSSPDVYALGHINGPQQLRQEDMLAHKEMG